MDDVELGRLLGGQATISEPSVESLRAVVRRDRRTRGRNLAVVVVVALAVGAIAGGLYGEREPAPSIVLPTEDVQAGVLRERAAPGPWRRRARAG